MSRPSRDSADEKPQDQSSEAVSVGVVRVRVSDRVRDVSTGDATTDESEQYERTAEDGDLIDPILGFERWRRTAAALDAWHETGGQ